MKFTVFERAILTNILPMEGSFVNKKAIAKVKGALTFSKEENAKLKWEGAWTCRECERIQHLPIDHSPIGDCVCGGVFRPTGALRWQIDAATQIDAGGGKDIELGTVVGGILVNILKKLDSEEKLRDEHMPLYEKIVMTSE